jgi:hypothetical protein
LRCCNEVAHRYRHTKNDFGFRYLRLDIAAKQAIYASPEIVATIAPMSKLPYFSTGQPRPGGVLSLHDCFHSKNHPVCLQHYLTLLIWRSYDLPATRMMTAAHWSRSCNLPYSQLRNFPWA